MAANSAARDIYGRADELVGLLTLLRAAPAFLLFGALYLTGQTARINELFEQTMEEPHAL